MTAAPAPGGSAIRPLAETDLPEVARLSGQLGYPVPLADLAQRLAALGGSPAHALLVAATAAGDVAGWIHVRASEALTHGPEAEIVALVVDEPSRGRGVGAALVRAAEEWARSRSLPRIRVRCQVHREDAHRFYARHGYAQQKTQHVFAKLLSSG